MLSSVILIVIRINNWGFIVNKDAQIIDLAPIYDCASSLAPHLSEQSMKDRLHDASLMREENINSPYCSFNVKGKRRKYAFFMMSPYARSIRAVLPDMWKSFDTSVLADVVDHTPHLDNLHKDFYLQTLVARRKYILEPALELALKEREQDINQELQRVQTELKKLSTSSVKPSHTSSRKNISR